MGEGGPSRHVAHHLLVVHGLEDVVLAGAVVVAGAGLDEHHVLLHHLPVGTLELHGQRGGPVRGAAAAVQAHAAELGPVGLGGGAAGDLELHGLGDARGADALLPFLKRVEGGAGGAEERKDEHLLALVFASCHQSSEEMKEADVQANGRSAHPDALLQLRLAGPHHAQARLLLQPTLPVVVGHPGGDAQAAGLGAGAPLGGLDQAVLPHHGGVRPVGLLLSVGCADKLQVSKPPPGIMKIQRLGGRTGTHRPERSP